VQRPFDVHICRRMSVILIRSTATRKETNVETILRRREGPKRERLSVTLAPGLARKLRDIAADQGIALTWVIEDALAEKFGRDKP
jgi:hypothetical protein